jgi:hypothetical protein
MKSLHLVGELNNKQNMEMTRLKLHFEFTPWLQCINRLGVGSNDQAKAMEEVV